MMSGLLHRDINYIYKAIEGFPEIDKVILFGSRAMGNYKKGSDVDLAIVGEYVTNQTLCRLSDMLNEVYPLPYFFDVIDYGRITNVELKEHINNKGQLLYTKESKREC